MDSVDDLHYSYIGDDGHGSTVDDMISFFCGSPELCRKR